MRIIRTRSDFVTNPIAAYKDQKQLAVIPGQYKRHAEMIDNRLHQ